MVKRRLQAAETEEYHGESTAGGGGGLEKVKIEA
jgi:hypothetical protein